jgi:glycosyl transferase family 1/ParB-like nuclease family protein
MGGLTIHYKNVALLRSRKRNPRTHTPKQIRQIAASIKEFGFVNPVLVDGFNGIIAGHGRVEAAKLLGMSDIPTVCVDHLTPTEIRAYVIADNRLAELAGWDRELLALELQELLVQPNFDVAVTGFDTAEVDILIGELSEDAPDEADELPAIDRSQPSVSRPGDLWRVGDHYLLCGNALEEQSYRRLLGDTKAQMVFTDPPYNVAIGGNVSGLGKHKHGEFAMGSSEMSRSEFTNFLKTTFEHLCASSIDGSIHFICMDWRHMREVLDAAEPLYGDPKNLCVWIKSNAGMGSLYRSQHELVFVFKNGNGPHINNLELGRFGRNRSNAWHYAGVNSFGTEREADLAMHPTVKPSARLDADIETQGLGNRVTVVGAVPPERVIELYLASDVFVLASRFEGYGMALAEAIAHGLPVVSTLAGAIPDTVPRGASILVPPDDVAALARALRCVIGDPAERQRLATNARAAAAQLPTWQDSARLFAGAIETVGTGWH